MNKPRFEIIVAVWGDDYRSLMLNLLIPSLLAPGNIPACKSRAEVYFTILTTSADAKEIELNPSIQLLRRHAATHIAAVIDAADANLPSPYATMAAAHRIAIHQALIHHGYLSILSPDCVLSDGCLESGFEMALQGTGAVMIAGPRGRMEDLEPIFRSRVHENRLSLAPQEIVSCVRRYPHAISERLFLDATPAIFSQFPSALYWRVGDTSFMARYLHLHPLIVNTQRLINIPPEQIGTIDGSIVDYVSDYSIIEDSDQGCIIELSREGHHPRDPEICVPDDKIVFVADWIFTYTSPAHRKLFRQRLRFNGGDQVDWLMSKKQFDYATARLDKMIRWREFILPFRRLFRLAGLLRAQLFFS